MTEKQNTFTLTGIADAHGIDQCHWHTSKEIKDLDSNSKQQMFLMTVRANANRQRHSSFFRVHNIKENEKKVMDTLLEDNKPQIALVYLKGIAPECGGVEILKEHAKSWAMIPNPSLDPYWYGEESNLVSTSVITK